MRRLAICLVLLGACGDDDGTTPASPVGTWRLTKHGAMTSGVHGLLQVTDTEFALGVAQPALGPGTVAGYTIPGGDVIVLGNSAGSYPFTVEGTTLTLDTGTALVFEKVTPAAAETMAVTGTITVATGAAPIAHPHVVAAFMTRSGFTTDPRDDKAVTLTGGTATFDLARTQGALGTERIPIGDRAGIAVGLVVVYDDRDENGSLDALAPCSSSTKDCIRGISRVVMGYRDGTSTELAASPYQYLLPGWTRAVPATDKRTGSDRPGLVSSDPTIALPHDVTVPADTSAVSFPPLTF